MSARPALFDYMTVNLTRSIAHVSRSGGTGLKAIYRDWRPHRGDRRGAGPRPSAASAAPQVMLLRFYRAIS